MRERPPSSTTVSERCVSLVVLGTGHGSSMVYNGTCSAAYVLCVDKDPVLLIGAGYGVVQQCLKYFGRVPSDVFVSSNRSHVSAELPVLLAREANTRREPLRLLGHPAVLQRIESHRLAELHDVMHARGDAMDALVQVCHVPPVSETLSNGELDYDHAQGVVLTDAPGISIRSFMTRTSECSAGVAVYCAHSGGARLFAVCGDSCEPQALFRQYQLAQFHVVVLDGRRERSTDHASFEDIFSLEGDSSINAPPNAALYRWCIGHYGGVEDAPTLLGRRSRIQPVVEGSVIHTRLSVSMSMHDEVGPRRFVNAEHHRNTVTVEEVRVGLVRELSSSQSYSLVRTETCGEDDMALPPDRKRRSTAQASKPNTRQQRDEPIPSTATPVNVRSTSPSVLSRLQQPTQSSSFRRNSAPRLTSVSRRSNSAPRNRQDTTSASEASAPADAHVVKRVYLFSNEDKSAPGRLLMAQSYRTAQQLKQRATEVLGIKPVAELHVMPSGDVVTSVEQLTNGCSVVVTKGGGERFHLHRLPKALSAHAHANVHSDAMNATSLSASPTGSRARRRISASPERRVAQRNVEHRDASSVSETSVVASPHAAAQFNEYMAQAAAILSSSDRQVSVLEPRDLWKRSPVPQHTTAAAHGDSERYHSGAVIAGALPLGSYPARPESSTADDAATDTEDIFGNVPKAKTDAPPPFSTADTPASTTVASSRRSSVGSRRMIFTMVS